MKVRPGKYRAFRTAVILVWAILFSALLHRHYFVKTADIRETRALMNAKEEQFMGVYFRGERIGYVKSRLAESDEETVDMEQEALLNLNILDQRHQVRMFIQASMTREYLLREFDFSFSSPFYRMRAEGEVIGKEVRFSLSTGKEKKSHSIRLTRAPYLSTGRREYLLDQGLEPGEKVRIPYFDPLTLTAKDAVIRYEGRQKTLIAGQIQLLHLFVENYGGFNVSVWLDDTGRVFKEESPAGFIFVNEPEFRAKDIAGKGSEILSAVSIPVSTPVGSIESLDSITLRIELPEGADFDLDGGRQSFNESELRIIREDLPDDKATVCQGHDMTLASTPYIQADDGRIIALVEELTADLNHPLGRARAIASWVYENIEKRPVLGLPDALTTLMNRRGDCNEHSALFAALARSAGIPTRIASGVMYHDSAFLYHAWNEVCIGGEWISLDTTKNQFPADVGHVKFVEGEVEAQMRIGALLGRLGIDFLPAAGMSGTGME